MAPLAFAPTGTLFEQYRAQKVQYEEEENYGEILKSWPVYLESPLAWEGTTFKSEAEYTYVLSPEEKVEINTALDYFKSYLPRCIFY